MKLKFIISKAKNSLISQLHNIQIHDKIQCKRYTHT